MEGNKMSNNNYQKNNYDKNFSLFYNKYLTAQAKKYGNFIMSLLNENELQKGKILDIMCGTGNLLVQFERKGWETYGVDISESMLEVAKTNLSRTKLIQSDIVKFNSKDNYQVVVATADALNHLKTDNDINEVFKTVFSLLSNDGYFIFDMNTPIGIKSNNYYISSSDEDGICIREGFVDEIHGVGFTRFYGAFKIEDNTPYLRFDSTIYNYFHSIEGLEKKLLEIGFKTVEIRDGYSDLLWDSNSTERVLFICTK